ncbi:MAG: hypothetical protein K6G87_18140 [Butyrivibrio sp.]|uniref:hypothetical protein n=1 Tax=Butyrivibrio sp. TaxID=28121 RepID=UPI0025DDA22E|nr:hypothetical protein [Butyrivibrio sp.]MCR5773145.1 hypothetical protein [Butyrivibrio sp.]
MRNKIFILLTASALILGGCSSNSVDAEDTNENNTVISSEDEETPVGDEGEALESEDLDNSSLDATDNDSASDDESASEDDYSAQIKTEVEDVVSSSSSLTDEIDGICKLYEKYENIRMDAETQVEMDSLSLNQLYVWQAEAESLLDRINEADGSQYDAIYSSYTDWEQHVDEISQKMAYEYEGGSIQGMIIRVYSAERYRNEAVKLAEKLATINGDSDFEAPDFGPVGFYGSYDNPESCIICTEGMESGSYTLLICIKDNEDIKGYITGPDDFGSYAFTSDDGSITGTISFKKGAGLQITEAPDDCPVPAGSATIYDGAY